MRAGERRGSAFVLARHRAGAADETHVVPALQPYDLSYLHHSEARPGQTRPDEARQEEAQVRTTYFGRRADPGKANEPDWIATHAQV